MLRYYYPVAMIFFRSHEIIWGLIFGLELSSFLHTTKMCNNGKFLATKFEFGGSFGMSLKGDCHEVDGHS
jgi:hypothetical protein